MIIPPDDAPDRELADLIFILSYLISNPHYWYFPQMTRPTESLRISYKRWKSWRSSGATSTSSTCWAAVHREVCYTQAWELYQVFAEFRSSYILLEMNKSLSQLSVDLWMLTIRPVITLLVWFKALQEAGTEIYSRLSDEIIWYDNLIKHQD